MQEQIIINKTKIAEIEIIKYFLDFECLRSPTLKICKKLFRGLQERKNG